MKKKILIVNDEADVAEVTKDMLEAEGYDAPVVSSGEEALAWLEKDIPDMILLDLLLVGMQGEEVCKRLNSNKKLKQIPVILLSANVFDIEKLAKKVGAEDYVTLPFDPEEFLGKIKKCVGI